MIILKRYCKTKKNSFVTLIFGKRLCENHTRNVPLLKLMIEIDILLAFSKKKISQTEIYFLMITSKKLIIA